MESKREALSTVFTKGNWKRGSSIVTDDKVVVVVLSKIDFLKVGTLIGSS